ncbi:alpha/beta hydrolase fold domain-containing protein [Microbacterium sp. NPDC055683]
MIEAGDRTLDGPHGPLRVRVYPATAPSGAALVWAHGGAFAFGDLDMPEADAVARGLAERGIPVVSVDYALAPAEDGPRWPVDEPREGVRFPVASEELAFALAWTQQHAPSLGADPAKVALGGASAGANLATGVLVRGVQEGGSLPALLVLAYPTLHAVQPETPAELAALLDDAGLRDQFSPAVVSWMYENYLGGPVDAASTAAVPGLATTDELRGFPPVVMVNSEVDELRVSGEAFARTLRSAGVDVEASLEPGTTHGHLNRPEEPGADATLDTFAARIARL